jgi:hypothetical protein
MATNGVNYRKGANEGIESMADLSNVKSAGGMTISPELFEKV